MKVHDKATKNTLTADEEQQEILNIKVQINLIEQKIHSLYTEIGKKYTDYVIENGNIPEIDINDVLALISRKDELENKILEILFN